MDLIDNGDLNIKNISNKIEMIRYPKLELGIARLYRRFRFRYTETADRQEPHHTAAVYRRLQYHHLRESIPQPCLGGIPRVTILLLFLLCVAKVQKFCCHIVVSRQKWRKSGKRIRCVHPVANRQSYG